MGGETWQLGGETWHCGIGARRLAPRPLAEKCGALLAEWVDATAEEMHDRIDSMSEVRERGRGFGWKLGDVVARATVCFFRGGVQKVS